MSQAKQRSYFSTIKFTELLRRWDISVYQLIDIIIKNTDSNGRCLLIPYLDMSSPANKENFVIFPFDEQSLVKGFIVGTRWAGTVFSLAQVEKAERSGIVPVSAGVVQTQKNRIAEMQSHLVNVQSRSKGEKALIEVLLKKLKVAKQKITAMEAERTSLNATSGAEGGLDLTPQQKATIARQEKTLKAWKPALAAMIKVAVRCGEEGRRHRQQADFNLMFNDLDAELNGEQTKFFRESLPDEHIDLLGDARGKIHPPDNV